MPQPDAAECERGSDARLAEALTTRTAQDFVFVDFDHTLLLENSTELYLDSIRPRWWGALVLGALEVLGAWRLWGAKGKRIARDPVRVVVATLFAPWTALRWPTIGAHAMARYENHALTALLGRSNARHVVVTYGYRFIVAPMVRNASVAFEQVWGATFGGGPHLRHLGKRWLIERRVDPLACSTAVAITDSDDDADFLAAVCHPHLRQWPGDHKTRAQHNVYLPLRYTTKAKYPNKQFLWRQLVIEDLFLAWLSFGFDLPALAGLVALAMLSFSFFTIYELGYCENDQAAAAEARPTLSQRASTMPPPSSWQAVCFAVVFSGGGLAILATENALPRGIAHAGGMWIILLLVTRGLFAVFNRLPVYRRIYLFGPLQIAKTFGIAAVLPLRPIAAMLLTAQVFRQTTNYIIYRYVGDNRSFRRQAHRLIIFLGLVALATQTSWPYVQSMVQSPQAWAMLAYCVARALMEHWRFKRFRVDSRHRNFLEGRTETRPVDF